MKLANTSFIHTSLNHCIVTRSPNHMCAVSCAMVLARSSSWFCVARLVEHQARRVVEDRAGVLHPAELERRNQDEVELARMDTGSRCSPRATPAPTHGDRTSRRGCARPSRHRFRDGTSASRDRCASRVSTENLPATNANRYVGSGLRFGEPHAHATGAGSRAVARPPARSPRSASRPGRRASACNAP